MRADVVRLRNGRAVDVVLKSTSEASSPATTAKAVRSKEVGPFLSSTKLQDVGKEDALHLTVTAPMPKVYLLL